MPRYEVGFVCTATGLPVSQREILRELEQARGGGDAYDGKTLEQAFDDLVRDGLLLWASGSFDSEALECYSQRNRAIFSDLLNGRYRFWFTPVQNKRLAAAVS